MNFFIFTKKADEPFVVEPDHICSGYQDTFSLCRHIGGKPHTNVATIPREDLVAIIPAEGLVRMEGRT